MRAQRRRAVMLAALTGAVLSLGVAAPSLAGTVAADPGTADAHVLADAAPIIGPGFADRTGTADCGPCIDDMLGQVSGDAGLNLNRKSRSFRITDPSGNGIYGSANHNQGVAVLRDTVIDGTWSSRMALTFTSRRNTGLMIASAPGPGEGAAIDEKHDRLDYSRDRHVLDVTDVPEYGDHTHVGGLQAQGDMLAIAMEKPRGEDKRAAVYFVRVDGDTPQYVATHFLGGQPEGLDVRLDSAATVGFTKRADGGFVMAVSGADNGRAGVWWYITDDPAISQTTQWKYVDFWNPRTELPGKLCDIGNGKRGNDCYIGGGGATGLVTGCDGQLYLVALTGTDRSPGGEDEYGQIFRVDQGADGKVDLTGIWTGKRQLGRWGIDNVQFRWAAGVQALPYGRLAFLSTERHARQDDNDWVDGMMRIAGSNSQRL